MKITAISLLLTTALLINGCHKGYFEDREIKFDLNTIKDNSTYDSAIEALEDGQTSDPFTINSVTIDDKKLKLYIEVSYGGGCEKHIFDLIWPEVIIAIYPPQISVVLNHDSKGDMCEAYLTQTLEIDLKDNPLNLDDQSIKDMTITVINGSNPDEKVQSE